ncbi:Integrator complex subunit 10 [Lamellibrachia satsuma]|nr:Integrator complex subunit 10 [Lamellibrachia satsuma]
MESVPQIHVSSSVVAANEIRQNFTTAVKCWELLHSSETLEKDLNRLFQHWKTENWTWLKNFEMDVLIYKGYFKEAVSILHLSQNSNRSVSSVLRADLQLACCYYCLSNFSKACEMILHIVSVLPCGAEPCARDIGVSGLGRQLQFLVCTAAEVLPYCIHLMITCFREKAFKTYAADDMSLGHMIVLLQYDWPRYEDLFGDCLNKIRKQGSFTYNIFFNYVINIDILEEFAYLKTLEGGKVNLDILPISTKTLAQSRTVTRGVIKGVKEDFKVTLEKQVARCNESMEQVIRQFLVDERIILQQNLL